MNNKRLLSRENKLQNEKNTLKILNILLVTKIIKKLDLYAYPEMKDIR